MSEGGTTNHYRKATVIVGKETGNKTRISKGAGAGMVPFTQPDKGRSLERPRAAATPAANTALGTLHTDRRAEASCAFSHVSFTAHPQEPTFPGIREGDDSPQFRSQCVPQRRLTPSGQDSSFNSAKRWLCCFKLFGP